jgi:hypothetical protein
MGQNLFSRRALIVDDEFVIAFDLEASMPELGFDDCFQGIVVTMSVSPPTS